MPYPERRLNSLITNPGSDVADTTLNNGGSLTGSSGAGSFTVTANPQGVTDAIALYGTSIRFRVRIQDEIIVIDGVGGTGNKTWSFEAAGRAADGTTRTSHVDGSNVYVGMDTAGGQNQWFVDSLVRNQNEFYWPLQVPPADAIDLDANAQWWHKVGTPTGGTIYKTATAESIATTYGDELLKCVAAASGDGLKSTWTYANEKRVKSGIYMAVRCAVYLVTAAKTVTVSLVTSTPTTIASATVTTTGAWQLVDLECGATALDGSSVDFKATLDGAGTFYVIPLGAVVAALPAPKARVLPYRQQIFRWKDQGGQLVDLTGSGNPNTWTDLDCTSLTSALATLALIEMTWASTGAASGWRIAFRRNGSSQAAAQDTTEVVLIREISTTITLYGQLNHVALLDDANIFEYILTRTDGSGTIDSLTFAVHGWWEWE